jgi:hypothetical protein
MYLGIWGYLHAKFVAVVFSVTRPSFSVPTKAWVGLAALVLSLLLPVVPVKPSMFCSVHTHTYPSALAGFVVTNIDRVRGRLGVGGYLLAWPRHCNYPRALPGVRFMVC